MHFYASTGPTSRGPAKLGAVGTAPSAMLKPLSRQLREEAPDRVGVLHEVAVVADDRGPERTGAGPAIGTSEPAVTSVRDRATGDVDVRATGAAGEADAGRVPAAWNHGR